MGNRKAPSPAPGTPGYRGPRQVKPEPPPAPPPKRVSTFQHDEPVLRYQAHIDIPPDPPSAFPANREIREGDRKAHVCIEPDPFKHCSCWPRMRCCFCKKPARPPLASDDHGRALVEAGWRSGYAWPPFSRRVPPSDAPRPGQSRYRLARKGNWYRVEQWQPPRWLRRGRWEPVRLQSWPGPYPGAPNAMREQSIDKEEVRRMLARLREHEASPASWQPVED